MSLRLNIKRVFAQRTVRVYSVDLHATEPRVLWSLHSGHVCILNYQTAPKPTVTSFEVSKVPVRSAKFLPGTNWIIATEGNILRLLDSKTGDKIKSIVAHQDDINCIAVHPALPLVLSSSNDNMIKVWNRDDKWRCFRSFEGHLDDVVYVSFNPKDGNSFASASRDCTAKMWSLNSPDPICSLDHTEYVNCVGYCNGGGSSYLITGSGIPKVWDYEKMCCIEKLGRKKQDIITFVGFHPELPIIITGSQDGKLRIWNGSTRWETYRLERTLDCCLGGVCAVGFKKGSRMVVIGYEGGIIMIEIDRELVIPSMDDKGNIIWAKDKTQIANVNTNFEIVEGKEGKIVSLAGKVLECNIHPQSFKYSFDGKYVGICGDGNYMIYTTSSRKGKALGEALEFVWSSGTEYAVMETTSIVKIFNKSFKEKKIVRPTYAVERIFGGVLLSACSDKSICFYDWTDGRLIHDFEMKARDVYWSGGGDLVAIPSNASLSIFKFIRESAKKKFEPLHELKELVRSASWVGDNFVYISAAWRINFYSGGEVCSMYCPMYHLERPMRMLGYLPSKNELYLFDKKMNVVGYPVVKNLMEYKKLVIQGDLEAANGILKFIPETHHNRGSLKEACNMTTDTEHKFRLAAHLGISEPVKVAAVHKHIGRSEIDIRMSMEADYEYSWKDNLFLGQYIVPAVRDQEDTSTCIFQSLCAAGDMEKLKMAACMSSSTIDIRFSARHFVSDYEAMAGPIPHDSDHDRFRAALDMFKEHGVLAEGGGTSPKRYNITSSQEHDHANFKDVTNLIRDGKPVIGSLRVDSSFKELKPGDIYDSTEEKRKTTTDGKRITHAVVFIGFGQRDSRPYLVFLNSHGTNFGDNGFGRIYFEHASRFTTIEF